MSKTSLKSIYIQDHMSHIEIIGEKRDKYNLIHFFYLVLLYDQKEIFIPKRNFNIKQLKWKEPLKSKNIVDKIFQKSMKVIS